MLLRLINGAGQRKADSGFKMLIESLYFWLVASKYYKKVLHGLLYLSIIGHSAGSLKILVGLRTHDHQIRKHQSVDREITPDALRTIQTHPGTNSISRYTSVVTVIRFKLIESKNLRVCKFLRYNKQVLFF